MPYATMRTKLTIPPARANMVARPRLVAKLSEALTHPLTIVTAPPGFGKTTLFSDWRASQAGQELAVAWVSLDQSDSAPARFWSYVVAALRTIPEYAASPDFGAPTLAALSATPSPPADQFLSPLLNLIADGKTTFALVLDDYYLAEGPEINAAMNLMIGHLPLNMRVVLLTRAEPGLALGHMRARGQLAELRAEDLRFTLPEADEFLCDSMACDLSRDEVALLQQRTEGWVAGLQMAALSLQTRGERHGLVASFAGDHRHIADYFDEEVLARQPQTVQAFLEQTSILDRLCGPLCDAVTNSHGGQKMLEQIERANLFLVPLDDERRWYRYHGLLAHLLRTRLQRTHEETIPTLHSRASQWYEREGFSLEAVTHALAVRDYPHVLEIIERSSSNWWAGPSQVFAQQFEMVPADVIATSPAQCILRGWGHAVQGLPAEASRWFDLAERQLTGGAPTSDDPAMLSFLGLARKYCAALSGEPYEITRADFEAPAVIPETSVAMRNSADIALSQLVLMSGDLGRAIPLLLASAERDLRSSSTNAVPIAISRLARVRLAQGRLNDAESILRQYIGAIDDLGSRRFYVSGNLHAVLADVLCERNNLAEAALEADEGIAANDAWGIPHAITMACLAKARVLIATGDYDGAQALINREERASLGRSLPGDLVSERQALKVDLWLAAGNLVAAKRWARDTGLTPVDRVSFRSEQEHLALARVLLATERFAEALTLLTTLVAAAGTGGRDGRLIEALILMSRAQATTDTRLAVGTLKRALTLAEPEGYVRSFLRHGEPVARLLRAVASEGKSAGKHAQRLLAPGALPGDAARRLPPLIDPLSGREIEVLRLLAAGMSNRDIADSLTLTEGTVKTHVHRVLGKLEAVSRTQAIARARELGLLER